MAMRSRKPPCISTTGLDDLTGGEAQRRPFVRLPSPDATAESWSARSAGSPDELAISRPSADTTAACATPGHPLREAVDEPADVGPCAVLTSSSLLSGRAPGIVLPASGSGEQPVAERSAGRCRARRADVRPR
jgi:hypothetical protein